MKSKSLQCLSDLLSRMPTIGARTADRMAYYIARAPEDDMDRLVGAIHNVRAKVRYCKICSHMADADVCLICEDHKRDKEVICVVEQSSDLLSIEKAGSFSGVYHVLKGVFSPLDGIGPKDLEVGSLMHRLRTAKEPIKEVILATSPTANGESTAFYLTKAVRSLNQEIRVSRIGFGVAVGSDLSYVDKFTLSHSLESRREMAGS